MTVVPERPGGDDVGQRVRDERGGQPGCAEEERAEARHEHHRAGLHHRAERHRRPCLMRRDDLRQQHLVRRPGDDAEQAREDDPDVELPDGDPVGRHEQRDATRSDGPGELDEEEQPPAVVRIRDHATERQQYERCGCERRATRDRERGVRQHCNQPRLRQQLQRVARIRDAPPEPEQPERRPPERRRGHTASPQHLTL